jgi:hypothetical protein
MDRLGWPGAHRQTRLRRIQPPVHAVYHAGVICPLSLQAVCYGIPAGNRVGPAAPRQDRLGTGGPENDSPGATTGRERPENGMGNYLIRNQTPHELVIEGADRSLKLAPLQRRRVGASPERLFGAAACAARRDHAVDWELEPVRSTRLLAAAWLAGAGIASCVAGVFAYSLGSGMLALWLGGAAAAGCAIGAAYIIARGRTRPDRTGHDLAGASRREPGRAETGPPGPGRIARWRMRHGRNRRDRAASRGHRDSPQLDPTPPRGEQWGIVRDFIIATCQGLIILLVLFVAVAAPAAAIYYGTELSKVVVFTHWSHLSLIAGSDALYIVVARLLQLIMLIIVSIVPALMYFQFDREKLSTLVDRWLHAIFRLDPSLGTVADVDAKYGRRVEEFYGASLATGVGEPRKRLHDRSPVIIATLLIAIGWIVVLLNDAHRYGPLPSFQDLFRPSPTPMTMGFLGAYFLAVQVTLRGYVRGDLKPKTYNVITVRILMAVILAWAAQALWGTNQVVLALSFIAGILPNTVLRRIRDVGGSGTLLRQVRDRPKAEDGGGQKAEKDDLQVQSPLSQLDEVDVYERTRLEEEGITSVQALARHDLVDLILSSRIPVPRLIDWVDQAILLQHVPERAAQRLRGLGIRTATDYLQASACDDAFRHVSCALAQEGNMNAELLRIVLNGDEWLSYIQNWRQHDGTTAMQVYTYDRDGHLKKRRLRIGPPRTQPVCVSAGGTTAGSTMGAGPFAPYTGPRDGQPTQNGDGGQPTHDELMTK